jgi:hypothetical protein
LHRLGGVRRAVANLPDRLAGRRVRRRVELGEFALGTTVGRDILERNGIIDTGTDSRSTRGTTGARGGPDACGSEQGVSDEAAGCSEGIVARLCCCQSRKRRSLFPHFFNTRLAFGDTSHRLCTLFPGCQYRCRSRQNGLADTCLDTVRPTTVPSEELGNLFLAGLAGHTLGDSLRPAERVEGVVTRPAAGEGRELRGRPIEVRLDTVPRHRIFDGRVPEVADGSRAEVP